MSLFNINKAQLLYYQSTYKGGASYDGKSYYAQTWSNADTIHFQNSVPAGCTLKKTFLISLKFSCSTYGVYPSFDYPISFNYNNHVIQFDTTDNATPLFYSRPIQTNAQCWMAVKDVTVLTQNNNNILVTHCQGTCYANECSYYDYDGFYLLLLYENNTYNNVNVALYLNDMTYIPIMNYTLNNLNPINTANDVGLSIESVDDQVFPYLQYQLTSSINTFTLGTLRDVSLSGSTDYETGMGSFYYQNGILTGLNGNINSPFIDSTNALCNIKTYLANNSSTFSLTANGSSNPSVDGSDATTAFVLAYNTPCPSVPANADSIKTYKLCAGQSTQLSASAGYTNYNWQPATGLNNANIANPNVHTQNTTNYICYVKDAAGCMHTEHAKVIIHQVPAPQSIATTSAICGSTQGTLTLTPNYHHYGYTYSLNSGTTQTDTTYSNLSAGHYTLTINDSIGCTYKDTFSIKQVNLAQASFYITPTSGCEPLSVYCTNLCNSCSVTNAQVWYMNGDSATTQNLNYTFTDTGTHIITLLAYETLKTCSATATQTVFVKYCPPDSIHITAPNVFSPNGDNINDTWQVNIYNLGFTINEFNTTIYDRWGIKVFTATNPSEAWSGKTTSGEACSEGAYFYVLNYKATSSTGIVKEQSLKGFIELIK